MKTRLLTLILFLTCILAIGQTVDDQGNAKRAFRYLGGVWFTTPTVLPTLNRDAIYPNLPMKGRTQVNTDTGRLEYNNGTSWLTLAVEYTNNTATITVSPTQGEKGVAVTVTVTYNIASNNDLFTAASINQGIGSVLTQVNTGAQTTSGGTRLATTAYTLTKSFTRLNVPTNENQSATYTAQVPQWFGVSSATDFANYAAINNDTGLQKFLQSNSAISKEVSPVAQYPWMILTNATGKIFDANNFEQPIGAWGDVSAEFWRKAVTITLQDGTTATVYFIRCRTTKTLTNFTYRST